MPGRLGCLDDIQAYITDQCGAPRICALTNIVSVEFNRILDDISEAIVTVGVSTGVSSTKPCCDCIGSIEPWCHELNIVRNGELVWVGPVIRITYGYTSVAIEARDVMAWTQVRVNKGILDNSAVSTSGQEITDIAVDVLNGAFYEHDPCVLDYVVQTDLDYRPTLFANTKVSTENGFTAYDDTVFDRMELLAENGLDYTVLGRSIILSIQDVNQARLGTLTDEHILGEIEVGKDGYAMSTRVFARYFEDDDTAQCTANCKASNNNTDCETCDATFQFPCLQVPCPAISEADELRTDVNDKTSVCYGPIERIFTDADRLDFDTAKQTADAYIRDGSIAPRTVNFPSGTRLSPDTPWGFNDMIPGQKVFCTLSDLCLDVNQDFKILEVNYLLSAGADEEISLSLGAYDLVGSL